MVTEVKTVDFNIRYACSIGAPSLPRAFTAPSVTCFFLCTRNVLLLKVNVWNFANFGTQNTYGKFSESSLRFTKKYFIFWVFSCTVGRPATGFDHRKQSILPRFLWCWLLWVVTEANSINFNVRYAWFFGTPSLPRVFTASRVTCFCTRRVLLLKLMCVI